MSKIFRRAFWVGPARRQGQEGGPICGPGYPPENCLDQTGCEGAGYYWDGLSCYLDECHADPMACMNQTDCEGAGWDWCDGMSMCNDCGDTCDTNPDCCSDCSQCKGSSSDYYWDDMMGMCVDMDPCSGLDQMECEGRMDCNWMDPDCDYTWPC